MVILTLFMIHSFPLCNRVEVSRVSVVLNVIVPVKFRTPIYFVDVYSAERKIRVKNKANISIKELLQHTFIVEQGYDYFHTRLHCHGIK